MFSMACAAAEGAIQLGSRAASCEHLLTQMQEICSIDGAETRDGQNSRFSAAVSDPRLGLVKQKQRCRAFASSQKPRVTSSSSLKLHLAANEGEPLLDPKQNSLGH